MQTFLISQNFKETAKCLEYRRLGKQRVEAFQILNVLQQNTTKVGWRNHPAVRMWRGYENLLEIYMNAMIQEWIERGYVNNMLIRPIKMDVQEPPWFKDERVFSSHRAALLAKDYKHYSQFGWKEDPKIEYYWPV